MDEQELRSNVYCTNCGGTFIATMNLGLNGNHQITCPLCQHIHYRVVRDGVVTEDRWASSSGPTYIVSTSTAFTNVSVTGFTTNGTNNGTGNSSYLTSSWLNGFDLNV